MPDETIIVVSLRKDWNKSRRIIRAKRAVRTLREAIRKRTKASEVMISQKVNEMVWSRGIKKPPGKVRVKVSIEDGKATVMLPEELTAKEEKAKIIKEEKEKKAAGKEKAPEAKKEPEKKEEPAAEKEPAGKGQPEETAPEKTKS